MNRFLIAAAAGALALTPLVVSAEGPSGVSGIVMDAKTKAPIAGVTVVVARDETPPQEKREFTTDKKGFFTDLSLRSGGYVVVTEVRGQLVACNVNDVHEGVVRRVNIYVGQTISDTKCVGPTVHANTMDADQTASLYRIR